MNSNDLSDVALSQNLAVNLRAMHDDGRSLTDRLGAGLSVTANVDRYVTYLARTARATGMTWDEIAAPLQITRQTAYARYGHGDP